MPIMDRREIEFDLDSLVSVIAASTRAAQGFGLPAMPPTAVRCRPRDGQVDVLYGDAKAPRSVNLDAESLGALLVAYCIRARIPMPRHCDKGVRVEAESVILAFRTVFKNPPQTEPSDVATRRTKPINAWEWIEPKKVPIG